MSRASTLPFLPILPKVASYDKLLHGIGSRVRTFLSQCTRCHFHPVYCLLSSGPPSPQGPPSRPLTPHALHRSVGGFYKGDTMNQTVYKAIESLIGAAIIVVAGILIYRFIKTLHQKSSIISFKSEPEKTEDPQLKRYTAIGFYRTSVTPGPHTPASGPFRAVVTVPVQRQSKPYIRRREVVNGCTYVRKGEWVFVQASVVSTTKPEYKLPFPPDGPVEWLVL